MGAVKLGWMIAATAIAILLIPMVSYVMEKLSTPRQSSSSEASPKSTWLVVYLPQSLLPLRAIRSCCRPCCLYTEMIYSVPSLGRGSPNSVVHDRSLKAVPCVISTTIQLGSAKPWSASFRDADHGFHLLLETPT